MKWIIIVVVLLVIALIVFGLYLAKYSLGIQAQTLEEARKWQADHYDLTFYDEVEKEDYTVKSYDGYVLHVQYLKNAKESHKYVIISHGYTDNHIGSLKYARVYLNLGFHVVLYDLRGHGENEPTFCTYSIREAKDLNVLIEDTRKRYPDAQVLGIHGESLGSATSIAVLQYKPQIDFVVADCGFSEIASVMANGLKMMKLPEGLSKVASLCAKMRYGYSYEEMRPIDALKDNAIPICFIHGEKDDFIVPQHSINMQKATKGYSEIHIFPNATHAASVLFDTDGYTETLRAYLKKLKLL